MCTSTTRRLSRALRRQTSDAQRLLWHHLRDGRCGGVVFLRMQTVAAFVVDFIAFEGWTIIEIVDAPPDPHRIPSSVACLERRGFRVLRFWDHDVLVRTEDVLDRIHEALSDPRTAAPGPVLRRVG